MSPLLFSFVHPVILVLAIALGPLAPAQSCRWQPPVDADVIDPFRPPDRPYGPGNLGLEYDVEPGAPVVAVAPGRVEFVGPVGGRHYVVIRHGRSLRSTYGPLRDGSVFRGQVVEGGALIAAADAGFHLTARLEDRYLDPQSLLDGRCGRARLIPSPARHDGREGAPATVATLASRVR